MPVVFFEAGVNADISQGSLLKGSCEQTLTALIGPVG